MTNRVKNQINEAELAEEMKRYVSHLREQQKYNNAAVKTEAKKALIRTGVLTRNGNLKKKIVSWE